MRILIAVVIGVLLAGALTVGMVQVSTRTPSPVSSPLFQYGTR